jgi:hypothetical protein
VHDQVEHLEIGFAIAVAASRLEDDTATAGLALADARAEAAGLGAVVTGRLQALERPLSGGTYGR